MDEEKNRKTENVLEQYRPVWLTKETHKLLREAKRKGDGTMAEIVNSLILEKYARN